MIKFFLLLSLLVTPRVFLEGGSNSPQFYPSDLPVGQITVIATEESGFTTFNVRVTSLYPAIIAPEEIVCITGDAYREILYKCFNKTPLPNPEIKKDKNGIGKI